MVKGASCAAQIFGPGVRCFDSKYVEVNTFLIWILED